MAATVLESKIWLPHGDLHLMQYIKFDEQETPVMVDQNLSAVKSTTDTPEKSELDSKTAYRMGVALSQGVEVSEQNEKNATPDLIKEGKLDSGTALLMGISSINGVPPSELHSRLLAGEIILIYDRLDVGGQQSQTSQT